MRKIATRLTLSLLVVGAAAWVVVSHYRSKAMEKRDEERHRDKALAMIVADRKQARESIVRIVSAHNPVMDWTAPFGRDRFSDRLTSKELAPALVREDRRPVFVIGSIVDVITQDGGCKLELDAKANLVSNIRFLLACTPAQVKEALSHRQEVYEEALEEIRGDEGDPESETPEQRRDDDKEAELEARRGYAIIVRVDTVDSAGAETIDDPPAKAEFIFAEGRCLELLYVGRDDSLFAGDDEAYLRLNTSEDEARARLEMKLLAHVHRLIQKQDEKGNH